MIESDLKAKLRSALVQRFNTRLHVFLRHEDLYTAGIPDASLTANGKTSWLEVKYGRPGFRTNKLQLHICHQLSLAGYCRYIIYQQTKYERRVMIVDPAVLLNATNANYSYDAMCEGFDHAWVADFLYGVHFTNEASRTPSPGAARA